MWTKILDHPRKYGERAVKEWRYLSGGARPRDTERGREPKFQRSAQRNFKKGPSKLPDLQNQ